MRDGEPIGGVGEASRKARPPGTEGVPFGARLRQHRLDAGLTQEALAARAGVGVRTLQSLEGGRQRPQRSTAGRLAHALGLADAELVRFVAAAQPSPRVSLAPRPARVRPPAAGLRPASDEARPPATAPLPSVGGPAATGRPPSGIAFGAMGAAGPGAAALPVGARRSDTPRRLADEILRGRAAREGEQRTVTVLNCQVPDLARLAARLGPEATHQVLSRFHRAAFHQVHRYGGAISQFLGDGFVALFGAPVAHEDSARRAVLAALAIRRGAGEYRPGAPAAGPQSPNDLEAASARTGRSETAVELCMGLHTGPLVVGTVGDDRRLDYAAVGETTVIAASLQRQAEPGAIYLSESTHRAVREYIDCAPLGALAVEARADPVTAYRALGETAVRSRFEAATERGLTLFVGREQELRVLKGYLAEARRGRGQVVFVAGEAGIGKSRLLLELRRAAEAQGARWVEGHCVTLGGSTPYLPIIDALRRAFGVREGDDEARTVQRVEEQTAAWGPEARATVPYLRHLLSVDPGDPSVTSMDPVARRAGTFDALRALLLEGSRRRPLVLAIEDLHWMDEQSGEALAALVDAVPRLPVLLILTHRLGYAHPLGDRTSITRLALKELPPEESAALAGAVLKVTALPVPLARFVTGKAEGNPFFLEEVTKALLEMGALRRTDGTCTLARPIEDIRVPDTIREVILSRLDRLGDEAKAALQLAAVLGREFTVRLVQRICDLPTRLEDALGELKALELIYERSYFPEVAYAFKHALTHEVALSTLLSGRRKALHRLAGAAIEELYADRLAEQYELLAHHYVAGEAWPKALDYLLRAGDKAAAAYANQEALDFYARALEVCERLGEAGLATAAATARRRSLLSHTVGDHRAAISDIGRAVDIARRLGDQRLEGAALALRSYFEYRHHEFETADRTLDAALALAGEAYDDVRLAATAYRVHLYSVIGRLDALPELLREADRLTGRGLDPYAERMLLVRRGGLANWAGRYAAALDLLTPVRRAAAAARQDFAWIQLTFPEILSLIGTGEYQRALDLLPDVIAACERIGEKVWYARHLNGAGWLYGELQDTRQAIGWNRRSLDAVLAYNSPDPECESNARLNLGDNLLALGRLAAAEEQFQVVERIVRRPRPPDLWLLWSYSQHLLHSYGELWLVRGNAQKSHAYADECVQRAEASGRRKNVVKGHRLRGQVHLARGNLNEAEQELATALRVAAEVGNPPQLWKTHAAIGDLRTAQGRPDDARQAYRDALAVIDRVAAGLTRASLRNTFLDSPHVRSIRADAGSPV